MAGKKDAGSHGSRYYYSHASTNVSRTQTGTPGSSLYHTSSTGGSEESFRSHTGSVLVSQCKRSFLWLWHAVAFQSIDTECHHRYTTTTYRQQRTAASAWIRSQQAAEAFPVGAKQLTASLASGRTTHAQSGSGGILLVAILLLAVLAHNTTLGGKSLGQSRSRHGIQPNLDYGTLASQTTARHSDNVVQGGARVTASSRYTPQACW